ncbi:hypothetical protein BDN72DRAFT_865669 [Pluteus cervinus]|uniref:Uncharacterized protein n=1 Tax=Pluteus cervinus TaxID=181527 RepID=A0ACD2ZZD5_9AGAR|nr:hypothetical protein BDN72DRAFT_865669 [Pluteus cervinus]
MLVVVEGVEGVDRGGIPGVEASWPSKHHRWRHTTYGRGAAIGHLRARQVETREGEREEGSRRRGGHRGTWRGKSTMAACLIGQPPIGSEIRLIRSVSESESASFPTLPFRSSPMALWSTDSDISSAWFRLPKTADRQKKVFKLRWRPRAAETIQGAERVGHAKRLYGVNTIPSSMETTQPTFIKKPGSFDANRLLSLEKPFIAVKILTSSRSNLRTPSTMSRRRSKSVQIFVKNLTGKTITLVCSLLFYWYHECCPLPRGAENLVFEDERLDSFTGEGISSPDDRCPYPPDYGTVLSAGFKEPRKAEGDRLTCTPESPFYLRVDTYTSPRR